LLASTLFTFGILPKHALEGKDLNTDAYNDKPLGTGAYMVKKFKHGQYVLIERNPNYWRKDEKGEKLPHKCSRKCAATEAYARRR